MPAVSRLPIASLVFALTLSLAAGILGRGYWTPDEPREADLSWRMSWQADKSVPLLAGEPFCEKPPLAYWAAGAAMRWGGTAAWVARLPNLLYALITALAVGALAHRAAGKVAGLVAAAAISTFLLSYQVTIWLATDAPLLAAVAAALLGLHAGFHATDSRQRLRGYTFMHVALAAGFLAKSAAAWMVPALTLATLILWERRFRELKRWELYAGLGLQAAVILPWVWAVYRGPDGPAHLQVFFWNNLAGRFAHVDAPDAIQYTSGHQNTPGKYLLELPVYLWPWTLLVPAALRKAWRDRGDGSRPVIRFAAAVFVPTLVFLSVAATARNIYLAPALPGVALLLGWWADGLRGSADRWDALAVRATVILLLAAIVACAAAVLVVGFDGWHEMPSRSSFVCVTAAGLALAGMAARAAWRAVRRGLPLQALYACLVIYAALLTGPAFGIYGQVDTWQDLGSIGRAVARDLGSKPLVLFAPDETTRAFVDMDVRDAVTLIAGPADAEASDALARALATAPTSLVLAQLAGRNPSRALEAWRRLTTSAVPAPSPRLDATLPAWAHDAGLRALRTYALPNGRRYALLEQAQPPS
jgi:4-amino-4-deoxy-L-arabinose transferase-like glycosyltransferase